MFGDAIKFRNMYVDEIHKITRLKLVLYGIAFSGWGVATALLILH